MKKRFRVDKCTTNKILKGNFCYVAIPYSYVPITYRNYIHYIIYMLKCTLSKKIKYCICGIFDILNLKTCKNSQI